MVDIVVGYPLLPTSGTIFLDLTSLRGSLSWRREELAIYGLFYVAADPKIRSVSVPGHSLYPFN